MILPGLVSISFRKNSPAEIVRAAVAAQLRGIEWGGDVHVPHGDLATARAAAQITRDAGLQVAAYGSYYRAAVSAGEGLEFSRVLETAVALGAPCIRVWAGRQGSAEMSADERRRVTDDLARCAQLAGVQNVKVALEFHMKTLTDTVETTAALLREAGPGLCTYWQPPHGVATPEAAAGIKQLLPWMEHVHVFHWWPDNHHRFPLREGAARWRAFLDEIPAHARDRFAMLEFMPRDGLDELPAEAETLHTLLKTANA
jgi:sugar phosphate isomerase/epimerase